VYFEYICWTFAGSCKHPIMIPCRGPYLDRRFEFSSRCESRQRRPSPYDAAPINPHHSVNQSHRVTSWQREGPGGDNCHTPKFWAVGKMSRNLPFRNFSSRNAKFEAKTPLLGNCVAELKFWAPIVSFVGKNASFGPAYFLTHGATGSTAADCFYDKLYVHNCVKNT